MYGFRASVNRVRASDIEIHLPEGQVGIFYFVEHWPCGQVGDQVLDDGRPSTDERPTSASRPSIDRRLSIDEGRDSQLHLVWKRSRHHAKVSRF